VSDGSELAIQPKKPVEDITVGDILGGQPSGDVSIRAQRVIMAPQPRLNLALGDIQSLNEVTKALKPVGIVWNEQQINLMTRDRTSYVVFKPELNQAAAMFFDAEGKKKNGISEFSPSVWEGEFEPIVFTKRNLIKFLKTYKAAFPQELQDAIKNMKVTETKAQGEEMLDLESDDQRTVLEERTQTNIPKKFFVHLQLTKEISADLELEAGVAKLKDRYDNDTGKNGIELRCINGRQVMRDMMENYLAQLPENIPRYYGKMTLGEPKEGRY
jgi:hypothetical protein